MKVRIGIILVCGVVALLANVCGAAQLLQMDIPRLPDSKLVTEINLPEGAILDSLAREYGQWLGMSDLKQISATMYSIAPKTNSADVLGFYDTFIAAQNWKTVVRSLENKSGAAILYNEKNGMLIIQVDPPGKADRQATVVRIFGVMDPSKMSNPEVRLPGLFQRVVEGSKPDASAPVQPGSMRIPADQPIAIPPSGRLDVKSTRSDINARLVGRNTAKLSVADGMNDTGELTRVDDRLVLTLSPKLPVAELSLPCAVPVLLEPTEGSLLVTFSSNPDSLPARLSVVSTGAPVTIDGLPLISGTHSVKSLGGEVNVRLSAAQGGVLNVETTGKNLTINLPRNSSAVVEASVTAGHIENQTGVQPDHPSADRIGLKFGAGNAKVTLKAVSGDLKIRFAD
jgi:hypothetical protein